MPNLDSLFENFLETAASIAVLFFIVSWIASKIIEIGQAVFNEHGERLYQELARCFGEGGEPEKPFTNAFYSHPLIEPLKQPQWAWAGALQKLMRSLTGRTGGGDDRLPGYVAPETFATVMVNSRRVDESSTIDIVLDGETPEATAPAPPAGSAPETSEAQAPATSEVPAPDTSDVHAPKRFRGRMQTLFANSERDIDEFRASVARWYTEAMDRSTGRFKRATVLWLLFAAFLLCVTFNINLVTIFTALLTNSELRATGFQTSEYFRDRPDEMRTLSGKMLYANRYDDFCRLPPPPRDGAQPSSPTTEMPSEACRERLLQSLWRDPTRPNLIKQLILPYPSEWREQRERLAAVRNYCAAEARMTTTGSTQQRVEFCPQPLVESLAQCPPPAGESEAAPTATGSATPGAVPTPGPAGQTDAPDTSNPPTQPPPTDEASLRRACPAAWNAVWTTPTFFWDSNAAAALAKSLQTPPGIAAPDLTTQLMQTREEAATDAARIGGFFGALPGVGLIWKLPGPWGFWNWVYALGGAFLSALLAAFGAPFWYDLLGKVSRRGVRGPSPSGG